MNQTVYLMIGKVGSGKSSWARMTAAADFNVIRVSGDDIRSMIKKDYTFDLQLEPMVKEMVLNLALKVLSKGKDVVIDDCHLDISERERICVKIKTAFGNTVDIIYVWVHCYDEVALSRRLQNSRGISKFEWSQVMKKHNATFTVPTTDENGYVHSMIEVNNG